MRATLQAEDITVRFGGLVALNGINLSVQEGQIHALIGPNGAGKTTLINVLSNVTTPTTGRVTFKGEPITGLPAHSATEKGIGRTFQNILLFAGATVLENVMIARHCRTKYGLLEAIVRTGNMLNEEETVRQKAFQELEFVGMADKASTIAGNLDHGGQRLLEIARALATEPSLLLLDEPSAGMNPQEVNSLMDLILRIRGRGITVLLIEHNMQLVMGIADVVTVLNFGEKIAEGTPKEIQNNKDVREAYLGRGIQYA